MINPNHAIRSFMVIEARRALVEELRRKGIKPHHLSGREINRLAEHYLKDHFNDVLDAVRQRHGKAIEQWTDEWNNRFERAIRG